MLRFCCFGDIICHNLWPIRVTCTLCRLSKYYFLFVAYVLVLLKSAVHKYPPFRRIFGATIKCSERPCSRGLQLGMVSFPVKLQQTVEKAIEQETISNKPLVVRGIVARKRFGERLAPTYTGCIDGDGVNFGGLCMFCFTAFHATWTSQFGCVCENCRVGRLSQ